MPQEMRIVVVGEPTAESLRRIQQDGTGVRVVVVENLQQVKREAHNGHIDGLVVADRTSLETLTELSAVIDASKTLILSGPLSVPDACDGMQWLLNKRNGEPAPRGFRGGQDLTLEDYIGSKFVEFVQAMKASSARSLHTTLIQATERPMIQHALRETDGNQIQAARLLGMNRNTLRKKIETYRISVKRRSPSRQHRKAV